MNKAAAGGASRSPAAGGPAPAMQNPGQPYLDVMVQEMLDDNNEAEKVRQGVMSLPDFNKWLLVQGHQQMKAAHPERFTRSHIKGSVSGDTDTDTGPPLRAPTEKPEPDASAQTSLPGSPTSQAAQARAALQRQFAAPAEAAKGNKPAPMPKAATSQAALARQALDKQFAATSAERSKAKSPGKSKSPPAAKQQWPPPPGELDSALQAQIVAQIEELFRAIDTDGSGLVHATHAHIASTALSHTRPCAALGVCSNWARRCVRLRRCHGTRWKRSCAQTTSCRRFLEGRYAI